MSYATYTNSHQASLKMYENRERYLTYYLLSHKKGLKSFYLTANSATYPEYWQAGTTDLPAAPTQSPMFFYYEDDVPPGYGPSSR